MPTYEYECVDCKYTFETKQKITDEPLSVCPKCNSKLIRLIPKNTQFFFNDHPRPTRKDINAMEKTWKNKARI